MDQTLSMNSLTGSHFSSCDTVLSLNPLFEVHIKLIKDTSQEIILSLIPQYLGNYHNYAAFIFYLTDHRTILASNILVSLI